MTPGPSSAERLNNAQITTALNSDFSVALVPLPAALWLFGTALLGLTTFHRRKCRISNKLIGAWVPFLFI